MSEHPSCDKDESSDECGLSSMIDTLLPLPSCDKDNSSSSHFPRSRAALDDLFSALLDDSSSDEEPSFDEMIDEIIDIVKEFQEIYEESIDALESDQHQLRKDFDEFKEMVTKKGRPSPSKTK